MKKHTVLLFLILLVAPSIAFASWWNPFSWGIFHTAIVPVQQIGQENNDNVTKSTTTKSAPIVDTKKESNTMSQNTGICGVGGEFCPGTLGYENRIRKEIASHCNSKSAPSITIISPIGGETYVAGDKMKVVWGSCNLSDDDEVNINLLYSSSTSPSGYAGAQVTPSAPTVFPLKAGSATITLGPTANYKYGSNYKILLDVLSSESLFPAKADSNKIVAQGWSPRFFTVSQ